MTNKEPKVTEADFLRYWQDPKRSPKRKQRIRRLLDFTVTEPVPDSSRYFQLHTTRAGRERMARWARYWAEHIGPGVEHFWDRLIKEDFGPDESYGLRADLIRFAEEVAPHRGRAFKLPGDYLAAVHAWRLALSVGHAKPGSVRITEYRSGNGQRRKDSVSDKQAIEAWLTERLGRRPRRRELATAQAVYSQRKRRQREA